MRKIIFLVLFGAVAAIALHAIIYWFPTINYLLDTSTLIVFLVLLLTTLLSSQSIFTLIWMLYAWENPENVADHKSPEVFTKPIIPFTALLPARHEEDVIQDTIKAIDGINYPDELKELLVLCRVDDIKTINKAKEIIKERGKSNIKLVTFNGNPINKPHALNIGLKKAKHAVVAVFDAEDEPHPDIYNVVNTIMIRERSDVVQSGVQLMNFRSRWFSALNVMEYYLWFKSGLHFFTNFGKVTPLGGNTVFFKKVWLEYIGGWDEQCLTEDADIGIRLAAEGARVRVVYDELHTTQEETPSTTAGFIKQRTRWNQGFLQIFAKGDWKRLPSTRQKLVAIYLLLSPMILTILFLYMPLGMFLAMTQKLPVLISLISFIPLYLTGLQLLTYSIGLYKFTKAYGLRFSLLSPFRLWFTFFPYQVLLIISSFRAFYRILASKNAWEKTVHTNAHREIEAATLSVVT